MVGWESPGVPATAPEIFRHQLFEIFRNRANNLWCVLQLGQRFQFPENQCPIKFCLASDDPVDVQPIPVASRKSLVHQKILCRTGQYAHVQLQDAILSSGRSHVLQTALRPEQCQWEHPLRLRREEPDLRGRSLLLPPSAAHTSPASHQQTAPPRQSPSGV